MIRVVLRVLLLLLLLLLLLSSTMSRSERGRHHKAIVIHDSSGKVEAKAKAEPKSEDGEEMTSEAVIAPTATKRIFSHVAIPYLSTSFSGPTSAPTLVNGVRANLSFYVVMDMC